MGTIRKYRSAGSVSLVLVMCLVLADDARALTRAPDDVGDSVAERIIPTGGGIDSSGIVNISIDRLFGRRVGATGWLLQGENGLYIVTAAHVFDDPTALNPADQDLSRLDVFARKTVNDDPPITESFRINRSGEVDMRLFSPNLIIHPEYREWGDFQGGNNAQAFFGGYDVALIKVPDDEVANFAPFTTYDLSRADPAGSTVLFGGYGGLYTADTGTRDANGDPLPPFFGGGDPNFFFVPRFWSRNLVVDDDDINADLPGQTVINEQLMRFFDIDNGLNAQNIWDSEIPVPGEGGFVDGDSGGPVFLGAGVVGGASWGFRDDRTDIDNVANSTFGEAAVFTYFGGDVSAGVTLADWISGIVKDASRTNTSAGGGSLGNPNTWVNGIAPTANMVAHVRGNVATDTIYTAPAPATAYRALNVGGGSGRKFVDVQAGGALTVNQNIVITTNGVMRLTNGSVTADQLIVEALEAVPGTAFRGAFIWDEDVNNSPTSLTADRIVARPGGDYVHRTFTGTLNVNHLEVQQFGLAFIETAASFNTSITNAGILDLGPSFFANPVSAGAGGFTQTTTGTLVALVGDSTGNLLGDGITVTGDVSLAGVLDLDVSGNFAATPYTSYDLLTGASIIGGFESVLGLDLGVPDNSQRFVLVYGTDTVSIELRQAGDATGRNFVGQDSLATVLQNWGSTVRAASAIDGDLSGDGFVGQGDLALVLQFWGQSQSLLATSLTEAFDAETTDALLDAMENGTLWGDLGSDAFLIEGSPLWPQTATIPEPATAVFILAGLGLLGIPRRRRGG